MNKEQLKEQIELYVIQMMGLSLVGSVFYWGFSVKILDFLTKNLPFWDKAHFANFHVCVWTLIIFNAALAVALLTLSICIFGISDKRFNRESLNNCFNS